MRRRSLVAAGGLAAGLAASFFAQGLAIALAPLAAGRGTP